MGVCWSGAGVNCRTGRRFAVVHIITLGLFHCDVFLIFTAIVVVKFIVACLVVIGVVATVVTTIVAIVSVVVVAIAAFRIGLERSIIIIIIFCAVDDADALSSRTGGSTVGFTRVEGINCEAEL